MNSIRENLQGSQTIPVIGFGPIARWPLMHELAGFGLFGVAYYLAYRFGMSFSQACAAPCWFPDSVLLCALLLNEPRRWWLLMLATLPIRLLVEVPPKIFPTPAQSHSTSLKYEDPHPTHG